MVTEKRIRSWRWSSSEGWIVSPEHCGFFALDIEKRKAEAYLFIDHCKVKEDGWWFGSGIKSRDVLVYTPVKSEYIALYDIQEQRCDYIKLAKAPTVNPAWDCIKFVTGYSLGDDVFLIGYNYPAIVKLNVKNREICYINDWIQADQKVKNNPQKEFYSGAGYAIKDGNIYIPIYLTNALLELNLRSLKTRYVYFSEDADGIDGISEKNGIFYIVAHKKDQHFFAVWDIEKDCVKQIDIPCKCSGRDTYAFWAPMLFQEKAYLFPITADHFYVIDLKDDRISIAEGLDQMLADFPNESDEFKVSGYEEMDKKVVINTWWDYGWHIFDFETGEHKDFEIRIEDDAYWKQYHLKYYNEMRDENVFLKETELPYHIFLESLNENRKKLFKRF